MKRQRTAWEWWALRSRYNSWYWEVHDKWNKEGGTNERQRARLVYLSEQRLIADAGEVIAIRRERRMTTTTIEGDAS